AAGPRRRRRDPHDPRLRRRPRAARRPRQVGGPRNDPVRRARCAARPERLRKGFPMSDRVRTSLGPLELPNPVMTASGCGGAGRELAQFFELTRLGAFVTTSVMPQARAGRPTPRVTETPSGLLTAMLTPGPRIETFLERDLPGLLERDVRTIGSVAGGSVEANPALGRRLRPVPGIPGTEDNIACPNFDDRGRVFAGHPAGAGSVVRA